MLPAPVTSPLLFLVFAALLGAAAGCRAGAAPEDPDPAPPSALYGKPEVTQFRDGKLGAVSLRFDDSMLSQAEVAIPRLNERGLVGTFFVKPALDRYQAHREVWEVVCPSSGHQLANHTMHHLGAKTYEEAAYEIGECSRHIWSLYPHRSKLLPFARGGGTTWDITDDQMRELTAKNFLFRHRSSHSVCNDPDSEYYKPEDADIRPHAQRAIDERTWVELMFHGVGSEWISCSEDTFVALLDFLVEHRGELWGATTGDAWKYEQERQALSDVSLDQPTEAGFSITLDCDETKLETYGLPFVELYDQPLTVRVPVPDSWTRFTVAQGAGEKAVRQSCDTIEVEGRRVAQFDVRPGVGAATVTRAADPL